MFNLIKERITIEISFKLLCAILGAFYTCMYYMYFISYCTVYTFTCIIFTQRKYHQFLQIRQKYFLEMLQRGETKCVDHLHETTNLVKIIINNYCLQPM